jgi:RNA polymerase sigma-70 factor (ECF subfamily)
MIRIGFGAIALTDTPTTLQRVAAGDQSAVRVFVEQYSAALWALARRYCGNTAEAEDAVQDVFVELWEKAERFDPGKASEYTFVTMVARRRLIDRLRRNGRSIPTVPLEDSGEPARDAADKVERDETIDKARRALRDLPPQQQQVIEYSVFGGLSHSQIGQKLGIPLGTVKTHARRGLIKLREAIREEAPVDSEESA